MIVLASAAILLAACDRQEQPEAPTAAESDQLNEAEQMLDDLAEEEGARPSENRSSNRVGNR